MKTTKEKLEGIKNQYNWYNLKFGYWAFNKGRWYALYAFIISLLCILLL